MIERVSADEGEFDDVVPQHFKTGPKPKKQPADDDFLQAHRRRRERAEITDTASENPRVRSPASILELAVFSKSRSLFMKSRSKSHSLTLI